MYLNRIRPPKPKFVEKVTKAEFIPDTPIVKNYDLLSYAELRKLAKEKGIKTPKSPKKAELIELLGGSDG